MVSVSLCMITRNEEAFLEKCLESVKGFADEIIIVDSGSRDRTREIAKSFGAEVLDYEWEGDYSKARNLSLEKANGDWILVLDADESISKRDIPKLRKAIEEGGFDGMMFTKRDYTNNEMVMDFVSGEGDEYEESRGFKGYMKVPIVRLFRNDPRIRFERKVHEVVEHSISRFGGKIIETDVPIHHFKELKGRGFSEKRDEKYSKMAESMVKLNPKDSKANFDAGFGYFQRGDYEKAIEYYRKSIASNPGFMEPRFGLSQVYAVQKRYREAAEVNEEIVRMNPNISAAYYNLGELYLGLKEYRKSLNAYRKALELNSPQRKRIMEIVPQLERILNKQEGITTISVTQSGG